jgi:hypothetical protein
MTVIIFEKVMAESHSPMPKGCMVSSLHMRASQDLQMNHNDPHIVVTCATD